MIVFLPALEGFALGGALIIAIGAQNAFILRQGLLREHVFVLCLVASLADASLIALGVAGMGTLVQSSPIALKGVTIAGAVFLAFYSFTAFRRAFSASQMSPADGQRRPVWRALSILLAFTFLNPHVYLDTVVLVGGISGQYSGISRLYFAVGAMVASFTWFFTLGYGARWLVPLFANPKAWRVLDLLIALTMALLSISLLLRL